MYLGNFVIKNSMLHYLLAKANMNSHNVLEAIRNYEVVCKVAYEAVATKLCKTTVGYEKVTFSDCNYIFVTK